MPIGSYAAIPAVASELILRQPRRVLDLGIGFGMLGAAVRQWIDLGVQPWKTELVGVEVWADYRSPLCQLYDLIYIRSIQDHLAADKTVYDMVLLGDVIEHFEQQEAVNVLDGVNRLLAPRGVCVVVTPSTDMPQGPAHGNPFETHRSVWTADKLQQHGFEILISEQDSQLPPACPTIVARRGKC